MLDLDNMKWQKPVEVFAMHEEDVPCARLGAAMEYYNNKLYVYGG